MTKRPRLNRPFCVSLLALAGLLVLSYFPLSRIRAANAGATILPSAGKPLVNLKTPQNLKLTYTGPADAVAALQGGAANPTALAAADFTADGAMDVVAGYSTKSGGLVVLMRGNPDAFAPTDLTLYGKAAKGNVPPTFLSKATVFTVPESPDLLATGDFNRDGYKDVLVGTRGGAFYLLAGDGHGNLLAPQAVPLPGQVTALAVTPDAHVAVSTDGPNGPQLAMLAPGAEGLTAGAIYTLPARGDAMEWGSLGGGADLAVGAGANVVMFYNALATNPQTETVTVPFQVKGLALGDFIWDRDGRTEISVLADDGSIHILQHGTLNATPLTAAELPARQAAIRGHHAKPTVPPNPTALGAWTVAKQLPYTGSAPSGPVAASAFNSPRLASASTQDLMVLDAGRSQLHILDTSGTAASPSAAVSFTGTPVAALALPQTIDAGRGIVVLAAGQAAPMVIQSIASLILNVNTTADIDTISACTTSTTTVPSTLSLREAVCLANNTAVFATINVPPGTYGLTSLETGELRQGVNGAGTAVSYNLTINGTGTGVVIKQTDGVDRIFEEDYVLNGNNPVTIQNVTLTGGNCTNNTTNDCNIAGGGAIAAGAISGDDLTLTNVVLSNNSIPNNSDLGGAIDFETPGTLTITGTTFSGNSAAGAGGAIYFVEGPNGGGNLPVTNSAFTNNTTSIDGGGLTISLGTGLSATFSGSTFTGNQASGSGGGGAIFAEQNGTVTVSNSRFVGNISPSGGTGAAIEGNTAGTLINNWWGCNAGPGNTGCDTVVAAGGGTATFNPWLVLSVSANPTQILAGATSTLTADLTHNSNGIGGFSVPNGVPVTFGGTLDSSVNPTSTTLTSGQAASTYTAGSTPGAGTGTATVDTQEVSVTINIKANTSTTVAVYDAATAAPWAGTEVTGASAYGTSTVVPSGSGGPTPTGTVTYSYFGNGTCASIALGTSIETMASGSVPNSSTFGPLAAGNYSFEATYSGDSNYNASTSSCAPFTVNTATTSIAVTNVSPASEVYGQDALVTITAVLLWTGSGPAPTASDVSIGGNGPSGYSATSCGAPSSDTLTCTATYTPTGADTVASYTETASFSGDSNYSGSSSTQTNNFSITQASTTTSVGSSQNPSVVGQSVTFTATIDGQYGLIVRRNGALLGGSVSKTSLQGLSQKRPMHAPVPGGITGTVTWSANTGCSPTTVSGDPGTSQCTTTTLPQGTDTITATYSGDSNHSGSMGTLSGGQVVNSATVATTTALVSSPNPSTFGESVTFTATVTSSGGTPNGSVNFEIGATSLGTVALVNGSASLTTSALSGGSHTVTAHYSGAKKYAASSSAVLQTVDKVATTTSVITSGSPSTFGNPVTFTATVSSTVGTPAGNVVFKDGTTPLGTMTLGPGGTAQFTTSALAVGRHLIHANYQGNNDYTGGTAQVRQVVQ